MIHFIKNNIYALFHFCSPSGRDSRQTFCDVYKGSLLLALLGVFIGVWRNTISMLYVREWLVLSETACWVLLAIFELVVLLSFISATVRRWQDLDIRIPPHESVRELVMRSRFWVILATIEGSSEENHYGPAPADTPKCLITEGELSTAEELQKQLFVDLAEIEK